jgi:hypothetical protein
MKNKVNYNSNRKYRDFVSDNDIDKKEIKVSLLENKKNKLDKFKNILKNFFKK